MQMTIPVCHTIGIVGAAISGPTLALQILTHPLLRALYTPVLWDQTPDPFPTSLDPSKSSFPTSSPSYKVLQTAGAAIALSGNGLAPLYALGLRSDIEQYSQEFTGANDEEVENAHSAAGIKLNRMANPTWNTELGTNMRIIERRDLQAILLRKVVELGGKIIWGRKVEKVGEVQSETGNGRMVRVSFKSGASEEVGLLVGAEGAWSEVRRFILKNRNEKTADERWVPEFMGATGIYGISSPEIAALAVDRVEEEAMADTHGIWLDQGNLSASPLSGGKIRWDLVIPDTIPPEYSKVKDREEKEVEGEKTKTSSWESRVLPGIYSKSLTIDILRSHAGVYHPVTGSFGRLIAASERIIRSPLRQRVWEADEIQCTSTVLIGDASRLMLPSSGQGSSFGIEDAIVLANSILNNPPSRESGFRAALEEYARLRVPRSKQMGNMAYWAGVLGLGNRWYWRWLRDYGTKWSRMPKDPKASKTTVKQWPFDDRFTVELERKAPT